MKSVAVLGFGVIALTTGAFISAGAVPGSVTAISSLARGSYFEAAVEGAVSARPSGEVAFGIVGDSATGVAAFTITLGAESPAGAILFSSLEGRMPAPGRYQVTDGAVAGATGFRASYIAGSAEHPSGLFRAERGILEITASSAGHISGQFSFTGAGFLASDPTDDSSAVTVSGAFTSTHPSPAPRPAQP
ncbi:MAG TPA: hypothetical protein VM094_02685 [Gemmatimonadales bacterium]|nr:hypothetical protein [Gemmatimonadales bacterium]